MAPQPPAPAPPPINRSRPQSGAVAVLVLALLAMVVLWVVGGYLLYTYAPADFGEPPQGSVSPSAS